MRHLVLPTLLGLLASCGGSNPGGGTRTLYVKGQVYSDGSTDGTAMAFEVREGNSGGTVITDAVVIVRGDQSGEMALPWTGVQWGSFAAGSYYTRSFAWQTGWHVEVRRGNDRLDAYLEAPGITTITQPIAGTTFSRAAAKPMEILWRDSFDRKAKQVDVDLDKADYKISLADDTHSHLVEPNRLVADGSERIRIERFNEVELAGGTPGSSFRATTRHQIELRVE